MILDFLKMKEVKSFSSGDDLDLTLMHKRILAKKRILRDIYVDFYEELLSFVQKDNFSRVIEIGSGAGFIKEVRPDIITSDVIDIEGIDICCAAEKLPFEDGSLDGIVMINVLHHIKNPQSFLAQAQRSLRSGGRVVMIEPANTLFSRFVYTKFHSETFDSKGGWLVEGDRPLYDANDALPWIIFDRDRKIYEEKFPNLKIIELRHHTPFRYLLSGGFTLKQLLPSCIFPLVKFVDRIFGRLANKVGLFQTIVLEKV